MKRVVWMILCATMLICLGGCKEAELLSYSFKDYDFSQVTSIEVNNLVSLETYIVGDKVEIERICDFLQTLSGNDGISAKGFYGGGTYRIRLYNGDREIDSIIFYCKDEFDYGDFGDGYPVRYGNSIPSSREVVDFFCQYDEEYDPEDWSEEYLYP